MYGIRAEIGANFADPVHGAQTVFQATLDAMARPGRIVPTGADLRAPAPLTPVAAAIALTLVDADTPVWLDPVLRTAAVEDYLRFHTGAPVIADTSRAAFGFVADLACMPDFGDFSRGAPGCPDRPATLVLQVDGILPRRGVGFTGPGIETSHEIDVLPLGDDFWRALQRDHAAAAAGLDFVFAGPDVVAACPGSIAIHL